MLRWLWTSENTVDQHQQMTRQPKSSLTENFTLDFKQHGFCVSPLFLQTLGPWFPNEKQNLLSSEKRTLDHWATVQLFYSLAQVKCFLMMFLFQKCLGSSFPEDVWAWWLLMHWLQLQFTLCETLPSVLNQLCLTVFSSLRSFLLLVHLFLPNFFQSTLHVICFDTALLELPPPFSNDPLWLTLFVECVNDRLLDHCQVSNVPHYCSFKEQEIPRI